MGWFLIIIGAIWLVYKLCEEASWNTNAYNGKEYDNWKAWEDLCCNGISTSEFKKNHRNGKYIK